MYSSCSEPGSRSRGPRVSACPQAAMLFTYHSCALEAAKRWMVMSEHDSPGVMTCTAVVWYGDGLECAHIKACIFAL